MINKVLNKIQLKKKLISLKKDKKKIVLCHGVFDILHLGHCRHFEKAKQMGDVLIVSVTRSKFVTKGNNRPFFDDKVRCEMLANISLIDFIVLSDEKSAKDVIRFIKPDFYVKGVEYKNSKKDILGQIGDERKLVEKNGGKLKLTNEIIFSSSKLLNEKFNMFNDKQINFLKQIKKTKNFKNLKKSIDEFKDIKVLVIGETIIDNYIFSSVIGKSGKDNFLAFKKEESKKYIGGAAIVSKYISSLTKNIQLLSYIGQKKDHQNFIMHNLKDIKKKIFYKKNSPSIVKTRYIDKENKAKVFGIYDINPEIDKNLDDKLIKYLNKNIKKFDLILVYDYDHGLISKKVAKLIYNKSKYLVLNYQLNSTNSGFHNLEKYHKSDCLIINENEFRTQLRNKYDKLPVLVKNFFKSNKMKKIVITRGESGSMFFDRNKKKFVECPAFANNIVDKVGAGDAFMSLFSLSLFNKNPTDVSLLFGSIAAEIAVSNMGNSQNIDKKIILKRLDTFFKV